MPDFGSLLQKLQNLMRVESPKISYPTGGRKLQPRLTEAELRGFEERHAIRLPEEYRDFLLEVGNGGTGPGDGIRRLDTSAHYPGIAVPFPFADGWCRDAEVPLEEDLDRGRIKLVWPGTLEIGCSGCTVWIHLVVTGSARGQIWLKDLSDHLAMWPDGEFCPCHLGELSDAQRDEVRRASRRYNFYEWYDKWLNESLQLVAQSRQRTSPCRCNDECQPPSP